MWISRIERRATLTRPNEGGQSLVLDLLGDVRFTNECAALLAGKMARLPLDRLVAADTTALPLVHVLASFLGLERYLLYPMGSKDTQSGETVDKQRLGLVTVIVEGPGPLELAAQDLARRGAEVVALAAVLLGPDAPKKGIIHLHQLRLPPSRPGLLPPDPP